MSSIGDDIHTTTESSEQFAIPTTHQTSSTREGRSNTQSNANAQRYLTLALMARDVLAIQVSTMASESAFSTGGRVLDSFRSSLSARMVEAVICAQDWLRKSHEPFNIEEYLEELDNIESDCGAACVGRCQLSSRPRLYKRACGTCCACCNCVPLGTSGKYEACPCYSSLTTHGNRRKCP